MPQPSRKWNGRKFDTKLDGCERSASCSTSLPAASAHKNDTTASSIVSCTCAPCARAFAGEQRGGDRLGGIQRGDLVGDGLVEEVRLARLCVGLVRGEAAVGLDHRVVRALARVRTGRAEAGERRVDDALVDGSHVVVADAESFDHAGPEVLHHDVGGAA